MKKMLWLIAAVLFLSSLAGCATGLSNLQVTQTQYSSSEKSLVFGGAYFDPGRNISYTLFFHNIATQQEYQVLVAYAALRKLTDFKRRSFVVELPPGDYQISRISFYELSGLGIYTWACDVNASFSVPAHSVVYVGNFYYSYEQKHNYFFVKTGKGYLGVTDDHENAIREFRNEYPNIIDDVKISLMHMDKDQERAITKTKF